MSHKMKRHLDNDNDRTAKSRKICSGEESTFIHCQKFSIRPLTKFSGPFPFYRQPKEIGFFSQDPQRKFRNDNSQLRYFAPPENWNKVHFDLRKGYDIFQKRDESVFEGIGDLLRWIQLHKNKFLPANAKKEEPCLFTDFVCWRGLLTRLLATPYENKDGWKIAVTLHRGTYYMCEYDTEQKLMYKEQQSEREKEMTYWGYKFEQYVTAGTCTSVFADHQGASPVTTDPVNNMAAYGSVVRTRLKEHSLVFGGEIDCCEFARDGTRHYVELKTSREMYQPNHFRNFKRFKMIKWWLQSFLIGLPKIVCGFRNDDGVVERLEAFDTVGIPQYCQDIRDPWEPAVCFNFADKFLQHVKETVKKDDPKISYVFNWEPGDEVRCVEYSMGSPYSFLPEWYYKDFISHTSKS